MQLFLGRTKNRACRRKHSHNSSFKNAGLCNSSRKEIELRPFSCVFHSLYHPLIGEHQSDIERRWTVNNQHLGKKVNGLTWRTQNGENYQRPQPDSRWERRARQCHDILRHHSFASSVVCLRRKNILWTRLVRQPSCAVPESTCCT